MVGDVVGVAEDQLPEQAGHTQLLLTIWSRAVQNACKVMVFSNLDAGSMICSCRCSGCAPCAAYSHHLPSRFPGNPASAPTLSSLPAAHSTVESARTPKAGARRGIRGVLERGAHFCWRTDVLLRPRVTASPTNASGVGRTGARDVLPRDRRFGGANLCNNAQIYLENTSHDCIELTLSIVIIFWYFPHGALCAVLASWRRALQQVRAHVSPPKPAPGISAALMP